MRRYFFLVCLLVCMFAGVDAQNVRKPAVWKAGEQVEVNYPSDGEWFVATEVPADVFARMKGKSYKEGCSIPLEDLRYLQVLHKNMEGSTLMGELVCHKEIASDLTDIFRELYRAGYPIERMVLIDEYGAEDVPSMNANNSSCFNYRKIAGTNKLSNHSMGKAVDINPLYNPWVKVKNGKVSVSPEAGRKYANRKKEGNPYIIDKDDLACKLFKKHGFVWGGDWTSIKDYQHFEKK